MSKTKLERKCQILECLVAKYSILWSFDDMIDEVTTDLEFESLRSEMLKNASLSTDPLKECCINELKKLFDELSGIDYKLNSLVSENNK